jgi:hypothetical protein
MALCHGLDRFSDHTVEHEPEPRLLGEAYRKHCGQDYMTPALLERLDFFRQRASARYGQSFRAPNLLVDVRRVAPGTRFLVIVRDPLEYAVSAYHWGVLRRDDEWDRMRLMPRHPTVRLETATLAERLVLHWVTMNRYLLDFVELARSQTRVVILGELERDLEAWAPDVGVEITDPAALRAFLALRPNSSPRPERSDERPDGWEERRLATIFGVEWSRARRLAGGAA